MHTLNDPIALIGIGCRLPGHANSPAAFWQNLLDGVDAITEVPPDRWNAKAFYDPHPSRPGKTVAKWGGFVDGIDQFDPHVFGLSPREASRMDPQQRLLLEVAWEAIEDAGLTLPQVAGTRTATFVGISSWDYSILQTSFRDRGEIDAYSNTGGSLSIAANRISYCFDLKGPSAAVDTACSSALVALHLACRSIWLDGCPMALAGGANALLAPDWYIGFSRMGMLAPDGRCRAFDARGSGFVRAEGAGIVVLKPLAQAQIDGDRIYAVIRGTAVNQDGRTPGMTMPDRTAQEALLREACASSGIAPHRIQFIEAHGTGTPVGDPIEAAALGAVLAEGRDANSPCLVGSVKTNIGHLEAGSGIAGLIKLALALHHRRVPGNLHFHEPNPAIDFEALQLRVPVQCEPWPEGEGTPLAGINSFGFGGTNAHAVLAGVEERPVEVVTSYPEQVCLIPLSARSPEALRAAARIFAEFVASTPASLAAIAWNASTRRTHHEHRLAVVASTKVELTDALEAFAAGQPSPSVRIGHATLDRTPRIAFVCAGQGPQWWAMGRQLLETEPVFRTVIEQCDVIVRQLGTWSLLEELSRDEATSRMAETSISQPAIFALQVGLAAVWRSWGIEPGALIGHSVGEVAAAHLAGAISLEEAVRVIYHRGRCMALAPARGRMLAVGASPEEATTLVAPYGECVSLAAVNGPNSVTLSGEAKPLERIAANLTERGIFAKFLQVNYAFHSAQMDPIRDELLRSLAGISGQATRQPLISTVTGSRIEGNELDPEYWWHNVRQGVRFADGIEHLSAAGFDTIVELSPHPVLIGNVIECYRQREQGVTALPSLRRNECERSTMLGALASLFVDGAPINWAGLHTSPQPFLRLPIYAWQRQHCWHESAQSQRSRTEAPCHPLLGTRCDEPQPAWETTLDLRLTPYLADHRVQHTAIIPATAFLEIAFAAAREMQGDIACRLEGSRLLNPCFPAADTGTRIRTTYDASDKSLRIHGQGSNTREWTPHFETGIRSSSPRVDPCNLDTIRGRCAQVVEGDRCYAHFSRIGLDYGPAFRGITRAWRGEGEALALVERESAPEGAIFSPALLDACLHAVIIADADFDGTLAGLYLPSDVGEIRFERSPGQKLWSHARIREKNEHHTLADIDIYDEHGLPIAHIHGLRSQHVAGTGESESLDDLLYAYDWRPRAIDESDAIRQGIWLIVPDRSERSEQLAERLHARGVESLVLDPGKVNLVTAWSEHASIAGIVHLGGLDDQKSLDFQAMQENLLEVIGLVQTWERSDRDPAALVLATRGAQSVSAEPVSLARAPLIGLGRVIVNECASLRCKLVDLDSANDSLDALVSELLASDDEDEVAWRGTERFAHRFVPTQGIGPALPTPSRDASYRLTSSQVGSIEELELTAFTRTPPPCGHVEVEVLAAGLNFSDVMKALGIYPGLPAGPVSFGAEFSGRVTAIGEDVTGFALGDEVFGVAPSAFAGHVVTRAEFIAAKPSHLSFEEAAALPIAFLTAEHALNRLAHVEAGERVLVHSATGGVGMAAVQLVLKAGAEVFATAGTEEKRNYLKSLGIDCVMDSRSLAFADEVHERTAGRGVDVVLNSLPGDAIARGLDCLSEYGRFLEIGKRDIYSNGKVGLAPFRRNLSFFAIDLDRVMRERPALLGAMLKSLAAEFSEKRLSPLPCRSFPIGEAAAAFRFMQSGKHIGKIVLSMAARPSNIAPGVEPLALRADATYLIVGGFGGFGLAVAKWLAERGAGHLVLVGRRGLHSADAKRTVTEMEAIGTRVTAVAADIANDADAARLFATIDQAGPPLRGVVHAAMVLEDALLANLDAALLNRVLAPKVQGAWNLHTHTANRELDFFALFSSLSSVFGHAGQANYAAANAFLDSLAWFRRSEGLPATTVNWGHLGGVGYLAERSELSDRLERQGVLRFPVQDALELLGRAIQRRAIQVSVMRVDWAKWRGLGVTGRVSPRFAELVRNAHPGEPAMAGDGSILATLQGAPQPERQAMLESHLRTRFGRVLSIPLEQFDPGVPLLRLGVDSLMAVELLNGIEADLHIRLPVMELLRSPGLRNLSEVILSQVANGEAAPPRLATEPHELRPSVFALSHGQRGLWMQHQLDRTSPALNLAFCSRIRSPLDVEAFRAALQQLVDRHPMLRTTFEVQDGQPRQRIHESQAVAFAEQDASTWDERKLQAALELETQRPFDLERGPLLRMTLYTRSNDDRVFLLTAHHIIGDFWALVLLLGEVNALYPAIVNGRSPTLPKISGDYRDFVKRQATLLSNAEGERLLAWWKQQLADVPTVLELPTDRARPSRFTHRGSVVPCLLDGAITRQLKTFASREGVTLHAVLLAAFATLLRRTTGQKQFLIGAPFAGRGKQEYEGVVGYFSNLLPIRADFREAATFRQLVQQTAHTVLEAFEHQACPFTWLVERLNVARDPSRTPLVQATFTLQKSHRGSEAGAGQFLLPQSQQRLEIGGLQTEPFPIAQRACQADLELILEESDAGITGMLVFNADLFESETAERLSERFRTILEEAVRSPDENSALLPILTEKDRQDIARLNATEMPFRTDVRLHSLFEEQARRCPDAVAVRCGERLLCYRELDAWAEQIAAELQDRNVEPGELICLFLPRSLEFVAAMLGVLKAGAAFVPLDVESPTERVTALLAETRSRVVLSQSPQCSRLPRSAATPICLKPFKRASHRPCRLKPKNPIGAADLAYVLFTSGSTGQPRGVMVEHAAACNTVQWRMQALPLGRHDRVLFSQPPFFDPMITAIFPALAVGAEVVLALPGEERDPGQLLRRIARDRITVVQALPGLIRVLLETNNFSQTMRTVRRISCGGEAMPADLPGLLADRSDASLVNLYGPTETAVEATWWPCDADHHDSPVPIGRPIANSRVHVLDEHEQPVPPGSSGELFIGGAGLARGYLNDEPLTRSRFVPNPFGEPGSRLFRTGDRVRQRHDGALEFLGRRDRQVKLRGHRIEPAEIEAAIMSDSTVREAVVVSRSETGHSHLVAYIAPASIDVSTLRQRLSDMLPAFMVPGVIQTLAELPRMGSGKVDASQLPAVGISRLSSNLVDEPHSPLQQQIAKQWQASLGIEQIGLDENFFECGGNSLLAVTVTSRLAERLGREVPIAALFDAPTIRGLTAWLEAAKDSHSPPPRDLLVKLQSGGEGSPLFLIHPPGGIVACYQNLAYELGEACPVFGIRARGMHPDEPLPESIEAMATEYIAAIRTTQPEGPYRVGGWSLGGVVAFEVAQQLRERNEEVELLALLDTTLPFGKVNEQYLTDIDRTGREYGIAATLEELASLSVEEQLPLLYEHIRRLGLAPSDASEELIERSLGEMKRLFHTHVRLASEYALRPYEGRIVLFRPMAGAAESAGPEDRGWSRIADEVDTVWVTGEHHTMVNRPHVTFIAEELRGRCASRENVRV